MASYDFDSDCPPLFKSTNYFLWQETMQVYIKHKDLELWEIIVNGPITIDKFEDAYTEDDYKKISKNFKAINILYCALTIDIYNSIAHCDNAMDIWKTLNGIYGTNHNVVLSEFVAQEEIIMDENDKQVEDCRHSEEKEYEKDDPVQDLLYDVTEHMQIMEQVENGKKDKNSCHLSTIKIGEYKVRSTVDFSQNNLPLTCHIFDDCQLSRISGCGIKSRKSVEIEKKNCFTSLISLISNYFELMRKIISKYYPKASFLKKLIENFYQLLTLYFDIDDLFSIVFKPSENSSRVEKIGDENMVSYGLPKVKMKLLDFQI